MDFEKIIFLLWIPIIWFIVEILIQIWVKFINKKFQWLIISKDEKPKLSKTGLNKFFIHGYDSELGWTRKPNTSNTEKGKDGEIFWNINSIGARKNPEYDNQKSSISCYGDSFTFCRQVNDHETWEHYLSKLENTNVQNFGVGNYGIDQSILRLKREYPKNKSDIVILAVVPDTICRIVSLWKHYYEYGNTFAFKPRFVLKDNEIKLIKNIIDEKQKFHYYQKYIKQIQEFDYFYKQKFVKEKITFPYSFNIFRNMGRNFSILKWVTKIIIYKKFGKNISKFEWKPMKIIMDINLKWRLKLFQNSNTVILFQKILEHFSKYGFNEKFVPIFVFIPQKDDIEFIKTNYHFYENFINTINDIKGIIFIDITEKFLEISNLDDLYSDDNQYGGHLSKRGNELVANIIHKYLQTIKNN
jgi:hypothetical protein